MKAGVTTSEFWMAIGLMVIGAVNEIAGRPLLDVEAWVSFVPGITYVVSRGLAKMNAPKEAE